MRAAEGDPSATSLRDVKRALTLVPYFGQTGAIAVDFAGAEPARMAVTASSAVTSGTRMLVHTSVIGHIAARSVRACTALAATFFVSPPSRQRCTLVVAWKAIWLCEKAWAARFICSAASLAPSHRCVGRSKRGCVSQYQEQTAVGVVIVCSRV